MRNPKRRRVLGAALLLVASTGVVSLAPATTASAATISASVANAGTIGTLYIDAIYNGAGGGGAYDEGYQWTGDGRLWSFNKTTNQLIAPVSSLGVAGSPTTVRLELYPKPTSDYSTPYDAWSGSVGGVNLQRQSSDGPNWLNFGQIPLPTLGQLDAFRIEGAIISSTAVADGRVEFDVFQIPCSYPDTCPAPKSTSTGVAAGSFATGKSKAGRWTGGIGWPGHYIVFVRDTATGRNVHGFMEIAPGRVPSLDLDAVCFGLTTCVYDQGAPAVPQGGFHPVSPIRVLDTRTGTGIANGPVRAGDGRHWSPDPITRRDEARNHDLKVTGVAGIPESGVSAVLLNVTAVGPLGGGFVSVYPRPSAVGDVFNDQATYRTPSTSNLNLSPGETVPNLVLARVGAGGTIRINYFGYFPMHVIADVAGWFDTGAPGVAQGGLGFTGVAPARLLDTRSGAGGRFAAGDDRSLTVAGVGGVPQDAQSVVLNITSGSPEGSGYVTAYPDGQPRPNASNLNLHPGQTRPNLTVVKVGAGGRIRLAALETDTDLMVDVFGYYGGGGGRTTAIDPVRVVDSRTGAGTAMRTFGPGETRTVRVAGTSGVPASATAVLLNVTATDTDSWGWLGAWPSGSPQPTSSNLNWTGGRTVANMVIVGVGANGSISLYNDSGNVNVLVDVFGYVQP